MRRNYEKTELTNMCMIYDNAGNILVQDRVSKSWGGVTFPGGHIEKGESIVEQQFRNCGVASCLIQCCENWAKSKGCRQFASDCEVNNLSSINLHKKYGFNESAKLVHFIKNIGG